MRTDRALVEMADGDAKPIPDRSRQGLCPIKFRRVEIDVRVKVADRGLGYLGSFETLARGAGCGFKLAPEETAVSGRSALQGQYHFGT